MKFITTTIPDVLLIQPQVHGDERGFFLETYRQDLFQSAGITAQFVQDNHSGSRKGILRGLHYQIRFSQGKLVRVAAGEVFDVAVDCRKSSPTFGKWVGFRLSDTNKLSVWIPPGFAHGFYVLSDWAEIFYKATDYYAPEWERTLRWDDPDVNIIWPLIDESSPVLSQKDLNGKLLSEIETFE